MKKYLLNIFLPVVIIAAAVLSIGVSCGPASPATPTTVACDTVSPSLFKQLYLNSLTTIAASTDVNTMDLLTHEYTFSVSANKTICAVGYKSLPATSSVAYNIEILNASTSAVLYSSPHFFTSSGSFANLTSPVSITAGVQYKVRRTITNNLGSLLNNVGRTLISPNFVAALPKTVGGMTIYSTTAFGQGGPINNYGLPYIDLIFQ